MDAKRPPARFDQRTGFVCLTLGFVTLLGSTIVTRGFVHGLFIGATIALMVLASALFGASFRKPRGADGETDDRSWLPSRDGER